ncbi:MAG: sensor histidine kinase N-terminal domain-containing protein [Xylophilus ampelinus]
MSGRASEPLSLRRRLLLGILVPVIAFVAFNTASIYREALDAVNTAYDRTLLASARSIGEQLQVRGFDEDAQLFATVPYATLETFEADNQSRLYYRVSDPRGTLVSGFGELALWHGRIPDRPPYSALATFYDDVFRGQPVRVAALLQPVASGDGRTMAVIQVAETLELRHTLAQQVLEDTLQRQAVLVVVIACVVVFVVQVSIRPVRRISALMQERAEDDLAPLDAPAAPRELRPLVDAANQLMARLRHSLDLQKRFVRDAAHQLRTPLAVLKVQVQSAQRGDVAPHQAFDEIGATVDRATALANQLLALARVVGQRHRGGPAEDRAPVDFAEVARDIALDLSPLVAAQDLEFSLDAAPAPVRAEAWMLRELVRNLLHNAIRHSPPGAPLAVRLACDGGWATLTVSDAGPGIGPALRERLFQPFAAGSRGGSGLGLAICLEIVQALGGRIALEERPAAGADGPAAQDPLGGRPGLDAVAALPLAAPDRRPAAG